MTMLSEMVGRSLHDETGTVGQVDDLVMDLASGDYPRVVRLLLHVHGENGDRSLPWRNELAPLLKHTAVQLERMDGDLIAPEELDTVVLLKRDVLDAQLLDLVHMQATRANDLWLETRGDWLELRAADVGPWAVLRRLGRGRLGVGRNVDLLDWKFVEFLRGDARAAQAGRDYHRRVTRLQPVQIARLVDELPYLHAAELITLLPDELGAETLQSMSLERQVQVLEELDEERALRVLDLMAADRAADLVSFLNPAIVQRCLNRLPAERRERVVALLRYPDDVAGGIMTNDVVMVPGNLTVAETRQILSRRLESYDFVYLLYVVDDEESHTLRGVLTLRELIIAADDRRLEQVMRSNVVTIDPLEPAVAAAQRVADHGLAALPVVSRDQRVLGAVTLDAALTQLAPAWRTEVPRVFT